MGDIKSAFERAMERVDKIGEASEEELMKWKYIPEGRNMATKYLQEETNLSADLDKYEGKAKPFVFQGVEEVLLSNIGLPVNEFARKNNKKAMDGIKVLKKDKSGVENVYSKMQRIFGHYEQEGDQQRKQAYENLKQDFMMKIQQAMRQQGGMPMGAKIDVERQPQFLEEWRRVSAQMDSQYIKLLSEYKQEIINLT